VTLATYIGIYKNGAWVDISSDVIGSISGTSSTLSDRPNQRVGLSGEISFDLRNDDGAYTPVDSVDPLDEGWHIGLFLSMTVVGDGITRQLFVGYVSAAPYDPGKYGPRRCRVTVTDWFTHAMNHKLQSPALASNKTATEALQLVLNDIPNVPNLDFDTTNPVTFPTVFDVSKRDTTAYAEISKIVVSAMGYAFISREGALTYESNEYRNGLRTLEQYAAPSANSGAQLNQTGGYRLLQSGGKMLINQTYTPIFTDNTQGMEIEYTADNVINRITVVANPRVVGTPASVLANIATTGDRQLIGPLETKEFTLRYRDPSNPDAQVTGKDMIDPVVTTDYLMSANQDGTGANLSANLTVTAVHSAQNSVITVVNTVGVKGYLWLQLRGTPISVNDPIEDVQEDTVSLAAYGPHEITIDQKYVVELDKGPGEAAKVLLANKDVHKILRSISYTCNDGNLLGIFLSMEIGHVIHVVDTYNGIDGNYYIDGYHYEIQPGGIVNFTVLVRVFLSLALGLSLAAITQVDAPHTQGINYGRIPKMDTLPKLSISAWVYRVGDRADAVIASKFSDNAGWLFGLTSGRIWFYRKGTTAPGGWYHGASNNIAMNQWVHVVLTNDTSVDINTIPLAYIGGSPITALTAYATMTTAVADDSDNPFTIGNIYSESGVNAPFIGGLKNIRVYNDVLTAAQVAAIFALGVNGNPSYSSQVFAGPCIKAVDATLYNGVALTENLKLLDDMFGAVGTPIDGPTCAIP
jgi:hypothetical protein